MRIQKYIQFFIILTLIYFFFTAFAVISSADDMPEAEVNIEYTDKSDDDIGDDESWMYYTWYPGDTISKGQEIRLGNGYCGNDSITKEVIGYDIYVNGNYYDTQWDGFDLNYIIPYESWHVLMTDEGVIEIRYVTHTIYGNALPSGKIIQADDTVPPREPCRHEILEPYTISKSYSPCPDNELRHYLSQQVTVNRCVYCRCADMTQTITNYTYKDTPETSIHMADSSGVCSQCGHSLNNEALYYSYLYYYIRSGKNPMYDTRITDIMWETFKDAGFTAQQFKQVFDVLEKAPEKFRNIYLLSFYSYIIRGNLQLKTDDDSNNYNGYTNILSMYDNLSPNNSLQPWDFTSRNNVVSAATSPYAKAEQEVLDALFYDVKTYIGDYADNMYLSDRLELLKRLFDSSLFVEELSEEQKQVYDDLYNNYNFLYEKSKAAGPIATEAENYFAYHAYTTMTEDYRVLTGIEVPVAFDGKLTDQFKQLLVNLFVEDRTPLRPQSSFLSEYELLNIYYDHLSSSLRSEIRKLDMSLSNRNASMISDIFSGVTNNKIMGENGHDEEGYWYDNTGLTTYKQLREAWAEYYSAIIRNDNDNIKYSEEYFPTATVELDHLADEILAYYTDLYATISSR